MRIAILKDHLSDTTSADAKDNALEAQYVAAHLDASHQVCVMEFVPDLSKVTAQLKEFAPDVVFNLVESVCDSGSLSVVAVHLLEALKYPYTGCHVYSQVVTADKMLTKQVLEAGGIATPAGDGTTSSDFVPGAEYILKAQTEHASIGLDDACIKRFDSYWALQKALVFKRRETGMAWMAEQYIEGREFSCAFLGAEVLPPIESRFDDAFKGHKIITYQAKWEEDTADYKQRVRCFDIEQPVVAQLTALTEQCRSSLFMDNGYARIDFRMDSKGKLYVIDINTNPCVSDDSSFLIMAQKQGYTMNSVFERIIQLQFC